MRQIRTVGPLLEHTRFRNGDTGLILKLLVSLPLDLAKRRQEPVHRARREADLNSESGSPIDFWWNCCLRYNLVVVSA